MTGVKTEDQAIANIRAQYAELKKEWDRISTDHKSGKISDQVYKDLMKNWRKKDSKNFEESRKYGYCCADMD
jgi:hypothetical protein